MRNLMFAAVLGGAVLMAGGCQSYFRVTDPDSGQVYFTKDVKHKGSGAVRFKDARTDEKITLQSSQVAKIKKAEFKEGIANPPARAE